MAAPVQPEIYTGLWNDWRAGGRVLGATITLSPRASTVLTNLIAVFIPLVGIQAWKVFAFCAHQCRVSEEPRDALHHQLQVVLANSPMPDTTAITFVKQAWSWRKQSRALAPQCLVWAAVAMTWALVFAALGIVLPLVVSNPSDDVRLIASDVCGYYATPVNGSFINDLDAHLLNDTITAARYASDCYVERPDRRLCDAFTVPRLPRQPGVESSCPFAPGVCMSDVPAYRLDSGYIDSLEHLGINYPPAERLKYRKVTTCALLSNEGRYTEEDELGTSYLYGPLSSGSNYTFFQYEALSQVGGLGYRLDTFLHTKTPPQSWQALPALVSPTADLSIFFLAAQTTAYTAPVSDPWFAAHEAFEVPGYDDLYTSDHLGRALACHDQHQLCNPANGACTPLTHSAGLYDEYEAPRLALTETQRNIAGRFNYASRQGWLHHAVGGRGASALQAERTVSDQRQLALPPDQWRRELDGWFDVALATLQKNVRDFATGPSSGREIDAAHVHLTARIADMCAAQTTRAGGAGGTANFSALGVLLIFCVGGVVIVLGWTVDTAVGWVQERCGWGRHRRIAWLLADKLHLHRMVLQKAGLGGWRNRDGSVPFTAERDAFTLEPSADLQSRPDIDAVRMAEKEAAG